MCIYVGVSLQRSANELLVSSPRGGAEAMLLGYWRGVLVEIMFVQPPPGKYMKTWMNKMIKETPHVLWQLICSSLSDDSCMIIT